MCLAGLAYSEGQIVRVGDVSNFFIGVVTAYNDLSGELNLDITEESGPLSPSIAYGVNLSGGAGAQGPQGVGVSDISGAPLPNGDTRVTVMYDNPGGDNPPNDTFDITAGQLIGAFDTGFQTAAITDRVTSILAGDNINIRSGATTGSVIISVGTDQPDTFHGHINDFSLTQGADGTATSGSVGVLHANDFTYTITTIDVGNSLLTFNIADGDQTFTVSTSAATQPGEYRLVAEVVSTHTTDSSTNNERIPFNVTVIAHTAQTPYFFGEVLESVSDQAIADGTAIQNSLLTASTVSLEPATLLTIEPTPTTDLYSFILNVDNDEVTRLSINTATDFTFGAAGAGLRYTPQTITGATFTSYIFPVNSQGGSIRFR